MPARRDRIKKGLGAVLMSTTSEGEVEEAEESAPEIAPTASKRRPASIRRVRRTSKTDDAAPAAESGGEDEVEKRHTSVYLHPSEFDLLDDTIYALRRDHGMRIPKTELWRALLHLAANMVADPDRVDELLTACREISEEE